MEPTSETASPTRRDLVDDFPETCWSTIAGDRTSPRFQDQMRRLVERYSPAIRAYLRAAAPERRREIDDLEQQFYAVVLHRPVLESYERERGRFRHYLKGALRHFLSEERRRERALRRRSTTTQFPLHTVEDLEDRRAVSAAAAFDRGFLDATVRAAIKRLEERLRIEGKSRAFAVFSRLELEGHERPLTYAETASRLGVAHHDVKNDLVLARKRFDEMLLGVVAETTGSLTSARAELEDLLRG